MYVKYDRKKRLSGQFWQRLFHRFAQGDIITINKDYRTITGILWGTYKMTEKQIHVQLCADEEEGEIKIVEFLLWENQWKEAILFKSSEDFKNWGELVDWWKERNEILRSRLE